MTITLKIVSHHGQYLGAAATKVFEAGVSIGRAPDNDWALQDVDRVVSGHHAIIRKVGDGYVLIDQRSTNGTFLNDQELPEGGQKPLKAGDVIGIGEYRLSVSLSGVAAGLQAPVNPGGPIGQSVAESALGEDSGDVLNLIDPAPPTPPGPSIPQFPDSRGEDEFFKVADPKPDPDPPLWTSELDGQQKQEEVPDNWWEKGSGSTAEQAPVQPEPVPPPSPPVDENPSRQEDPAESIPSPVPSPPVDRHQLAVLLAGLGVEPSEADDETLETLGLVMRIIVEGMVEVLRARAEVKDEFRVSMTRLKAAGNNPLKLAITTEDALRKLFVERDGGYLDPVSAFQEGFEDIKGHQLAMLVGMRAGYRAVLERFDPERLERAFDDGLMRSPMLGVVNKTKYWDLYRKKFEELGDEEESFRRLFGDAFSEAYEEQIARLTRQ